MRKKRLRCSIIGTLPQGYDDVEQFGSEAEHAGAIQGHQISSDGHETCSEEDFSKEAGRELVDDVTG
jgi:hypothetical protein